MRRYIRSTLKYRERLPLDSASYLHTNVEQSKAQLAAAMADEHCLGFTLVEELLSVLLEPSVKEFINHALRDRPDRNGRFHVLTLIDEENGRRFDVKTR